MWAAETDVSTTADPFGRPVQITPEVFVEVRRRPTRRIE